MVDQQRERLLIADISPPQTTSSTDGQIRVWKLDSGTEPTCLQVLDGLIKADESE